MTTTGAERLIESSPDHRNSTWQRANQIADHFQSLHGWDLDSDDHLATDIRSYADGYLRLGTVLSSFVRDPLVRSCLVDQFEMTDPLSGEPWGVSNEFVHDLGQQLETVSHGLKVEELLRAPSSFTEKWADRVQGFEISLQGYIMVGVQDESRATALYKHVQKHGEYLRIVNRSAMKFEASEVVQSLGQIVHLANRFTQEARSSAESAQQAAGLASDSGLALHFAKLGTTELKSADKFRWGAMGSMLVGALVAGTFILGPIFGWEQIGISDNNYPHLVQRALLVGGLFTFAAYLSKQAHNHRTLGTWGSTLAVQLKTFDGYADAVKYPEVSSVLRKDFAARVFGSQPGTKDGSSSDGGEALVQKAAELISKIMPGDK